MHYNTLFPSLTHYPKHESERLKKLLFYERAAYNEGIHAIVGVDEVGRGCLAGPVVACAYLLNPSNIVAHVNDSKQLSAAKRDAIYKLLIKDRSHFYVSIVEHSIIDTINIYQATLSAMYSAIENLPIQPQLILVDGMDLKKSSYPYKKIIGGDAKSYTIAAASIIAKETRDRLMVQYDLLYPHYAFKNNKGYGTKKHLEAIQQVGLSPIHRKSFSPCLLT